MVIWLVLAIASPNASNTAPAMMHIGNYSTIKACETAAKEATYPGPLANNAQPTFVCVRANDGSQRAPG